MNLETRSHEPELMDDLQCHGQVVDQTLHELDIINKWLGGNHVTLSGLDQLLKTVSPPDQLQIVDLGSGSGEMLRVVRDWSNKKRIKTEFIGIDANPHIVRYAQTQASDITFRTMDIFSDAFDQLHADIFMAVLFLHHFDDQRLIDLFQKLHRQAKVGIVVNDIHRHWFSYHSIKWLTRLLSNSEMVKYDAPLSVRRAFTRADLASILGKAGITKYFLKWKWAFRWQLVIPKSLA